MPPERHTPARPAPAQRLAAPRLCALGSIVNTHGIRGEVRMLPYNPRSETVCAGLTITLRWPDRSTPARIRAVRAHKQFRLVQFEGYASATDAEALVGAEVCIDRRQLPPPGAGEVYHHDLIGLRVETVDGLELGVIDGIMSTGSNDVCVVRGAGGEHLIPLIADVVREIDVEGGRLVINPLPGLLEAGE